MLNKNQIRAIEMLFEATDEEIITTLGIKKETLDLWKDRPEFTGTLNRKLNENLLSARRLLSKICVDSCRELEALIKSDDAKDKSKAIIEVLKASGLFKEMHTADSNELQELIERLSNENENSES